MKKLLCLLLTLLLIHPALAEDALDAPDASSLLPCADGTVLAVSADLRVLRRDTAGDWALVLSAEQISAACPPRFMPDAANALLLPGENGAYALLLLDAYPVNEIAESVNAVSVSDVNALVDEYYEKYNILLEGRDPEEFKKHVAVQAQIELGFERFLEEKNYQAIVTHFGDLGALKQLPGLAIQRLMEKGYGFGAEGDWKVAAMVRLMKIMTAGKKDAKGTSMLEDYTYNLIKGKEGILEAHMLEICPTIADGPISIKCQPLSMGDREDPARLVFTSKEGHGIATSLIDMGNRFRLIINDVNCKKVEKPMPKLPTATNFWTPEPDLYTGAEAWILAGGAHHTAFTYDLTAEQMGDWAAMMGIEAVYIDKDTKIRDLKRDLMLGEVFYR